MTEPKSDEPELVLQYLLGHENEVQLVSRLRKPGVFEVEIWSLPGASLSIDALLSQFEAENPRPSLDAVSQRIPVRRESIEVDSSSSLGQLISEGYALKIPLVRPTLAHLDAPWFRLEVRSLATTLSITMNAPAVNTTGDVLVDWMRRVRVEIDGFLASREAR